MSLDALELLNQLENLRESSKREKRVRVEWSKQQHHQQQSMQQSVSQLLSVSRYSQQDQPSESVVIVISQSDCPREEVIDISS